MITTETLFFTQVATLVAFVGSAFVLYRLLVDQKEATIQTQKENIAFLKDQLSEANARSPDVLAKRLADRIKMLEEELELAVSSQSTSQEQVTAAKEELARAQLEAYKLSTELVRASSILKSVCPTCGAPLHELSYVYGTIGGERDSLAHEHLLFECGREEIDRDTWKKCGATGARSAG